MNQRKMNKTQKLLAIDPGTKNIGIALSDQSQILAFAKETAPSNPEGLQRIVELYKSEQCSKLIVGIPLRHDKFHPSQKIAKKLQELAPEICVEFFNEDFSTQDAIEKLKAAGYSREEIQAKKDSMSAQVILTKYIESDTPQKT